MALYESTFIARPDITANDAEKLADKFASIIEGGKGKVVKREYWGLRQLAYQINKSGRGHYIFFGIDGEPSIIDEMERKMRLSDDVVRIMTIRVDEISKEASAPMREDNDEKGE